MPSHLSKLVNFTGRIFQGNWELYTENCIQKAVYREPYTDSSIPRAVYREPYTERCIPRAYTESSIARAVYQDPYTKNRIPISVYRELYTGVKCNWVEQRFSIADAHTDWITHQVSKRMPRRSRCLLQHHHTLASVCRGGADASCNIIAL